MFLNEKLVAKKDSADRASSLRNVCFCVLAQWWLQTEED